MRRFVSWGILKKERKKNHYDGPLFALHLKLLRSRLAIVSCSPINASRGFAAPFRFAAAAAAWQSEIGEQSLRREDAQRRIRKLNCLSRRAGIETDFRGEHVVFFFLQINQFRGDECETNGTPTRSTLF